MSNPVLNTSIRYPSFDLIRLLLAVEVVVVHTWASLDPHFNWPGFIRAVPAFLAVSGFLVLKSFASTGSWPAFARKRALRIFPALITSLLLGYVLLDYTFLINSLTVWITGGWMMPPHTNSALWSLAWEELAYAVLAVLWALGAYKRPVYIWLLLAVASVISWKVTTLPISPYFHVLSYLAPAFFTGNLMFLHQDRLMRLGSVLPWVFFVVVCLWTYIPVPGIGGDMAPSVVQAFAVVWAGMAGAKLIPAKIPDLSYGMYVYHIPMILFLNATYKPENPFLIGLILTVALVMFSTASWYLIEKPALRLKNRASAAPVDGVRVS